MNETSQSAIRWGVVLGHTGESMRGPLDATVVGTGHVTIVAGKHVPLLIALR